MIQIKNLFRESIGFSSSILPIPRSDKEKIYINLRGKNKIGGPDRFLRNLCEVLNEKNIFVSNWILKDCRAALVFSASWGNSFTWLCKQLGIRSVLRVDGFYTPSVYGDKKKRKLTDYQRYVNDKLKMDLSNFNHIIYQSAFSKEQADLQLQKRNSDFSIIQNGVDTEFFKPVQNALSQQKPTLIVLGKHYPEHLELALEVFKKIRTVQNFRMLVVGPMRDGSNKVADFIADKIGNSSIFKDIVCLGTVYYDDLPSVLSQGDVFLHVKIGDWCPNAVIEAMSCGLPVVCPAWGGTKELIGDGGKSVNGLPWEVNSELCDGMVNSIIDIFNNLDLYKENARKRAVEKFDIRHVVNKYLNVLGIDK